MVPKTCHGNKSRRCTLGYRAADLVPSATCHEPEEGYGPLGTSQEMNSSPAVCRGWTDFKNLIIAVVGAL